MKQFPPWIKKRFEDAEQVSQTRSIVEELGLHTVCESARCPNREECFKNKTATFLILGDVCTRSCGFCGVTTGRPLSPDLREPEKVAAACGKLGLKYVVVTSVDRDDLPDSGAAHYAAVIETVKRKLPRAGIEVLIPDFKGSSSALRTVISALPDVLAHNVDVVPRLHKEIKPRAFYARSIELLKRAKVTSSAVYTKSGLMLGFGESEEEVYEVMRDLRAAACDILTLGQYLQPTRASAPVVEFIHPDRFSRYEEEAYAMGFLKVASGPFVRSSYHAEELFDSVK